MKARIKKTGEIVNLASYATITLEVCDSWGNPIELKPEEIELIQDKKDDFDWQSFRNQAAKDILCAMISNEGVADEKNIDDFTKDNQANDAVLYADKLISKLKEKEKEEK
jgi:hypothetical protein